MHICEETPYITRIQRPLDISHTRTVLSIDDDAMYWLLDEKSKSENDQEVQITQLWMIETKEIRCIYCTSDANSLTTNESSVPS